MAKIKIHELAKELDRQSKEVIAFLQEKGIEAKVAQSTVEEDAAALVRKHFGGGAKEQTKEEAKVTKEAPKRAPEKKEAPKAEAAAAETAGKRTPQGLRMHPRRKRRSFREQSPELQSTGTAGRKTAGRSEQTCTGAEQQTGSEWQAGTGKQTRTER